MGIGRQLRQRLMGALARDQFLVSRQVPGEQVRSLIERLRPRVPQAGLIRVGPDGDGGYLVPDDLDGIVACVSPGMDVELGFDFEIAERGIDVIMADASVEGPVIDHERFYFTKHFVGAVDTDNHLRLETLCARLAPPDGDLLLQMDIEGAEWAVLLDASPELLARFRIIIIEFHTVDDLLFHPACHLQTAQVFEKLLASHTVVHNHPNNYYPTPAHDGVAVPPLLEMTFLRNDRGLTDQYAVQYPHPLDADCVPENPTVVLPPEWR